MTEPRILVASRIAGTLGPFDISVSEFVKPGQLVVANIDEIDKGIGLVLDTSHCSLD